MYYVDIAPSRPFMDTLTYEYIQPLSVGTRVEIPVGRSKCYGFVIGIREEKPEAFEVKEILDVVDANPYFSEKNLEFYRWISRYYHYPLGEALSRITPSYIPKKEIVFKDCEGTLIAEDFPVVDFTDDQTEAQKILMDVEEQKRVISRNLLHGVTGSGKTEVYIEIIKETIRNGRGVIVIVPEIALTPQLIDRVSIHFKGEISVLHSGIPKRQRYENWIKLSTGRSLLSIGARSAIFSPISNLGLVIVDEEQDSSYKQDDRLRYNARDLALVLGKQFNAEVILSSATPSVETYYNSKRKKYSYIYLKNRVRGLSLPKTVLVDLKKAKMRTFSLSCELAERIEDTLKKRQQVILYINRRGYSNTIICKTCGEKFSCPRCSITLTEHRKKEVLLCHYCGYVRTLPNYCSTCQSDNLYSVGYGTERVYEEIKTIFPDARIARMDSDVICSKRKLSEILKKIAMGEVDIIVGTQILGKGHDFPNVTLVGMVNADVALQLPDFRASEKTFQQIMQVSGRSGRTGEGLVVVQTYTPEHFAVQAAVKNDHEAFYNRELDDRKEVMYPPFVHLVDIKFSSTAKDISQKSSESAEKLISDIIKKQKLDIKLLGPAPSPIPIINKRHRYHLLLKGESRSQLNQLLKVFNREFKKNRNLRLSIDVDPYSLI